MTALLLGRSFVRAGHSAASLRHELRALLVGLLAAGRGECGQGAAEPAQVPASAKVVVHYSLLGTNDPAVNTCVLEAIADLRRDTCLEFSERPAPRAAPALSFVDSG